MALLLSSLVAFAGWINKLIHWFRACLKLSLTAHGHISPPSPPFLAMDRKHALDGEPPLPPRHRRRLRPGRTSLGLTISTEFPPEAPSASTTLPNTGTASLSVSLPAHLNPFLPAPSPMSVPTLSASSSFTSDNGTPMAGESCGTPRDQMLPSSASSSRSSGGRPSLPSVSGPVRLTRRPSLAQTLMGRSQSRRGRGAGARMGGGSSSSSSAASASSSSSSKSLAQLGSAVNRYHTDFEELKLIDSGSFGIVTKVRKRFDGCRYAVKRTRCPMGGKPVGGGRVALTDVLKEVFALAALDVCPFVVRYFNAWIEEGYGYIQMVRAGRCGERAVRGRVCVCVWEYGVPVSRRCRRRRELARVCVYAAGAGTRTRVDLLCRLHSIPLYSLTLTHCCRDLQKELCDYSLNKLMEKPQVTMETIIHVARDAARGISHLHRQNLVHLDIKVRSHGRSHGVCLHGSSCVLCARLVVRLFRR